MTNIGTYSPNSVFTLIQSIEDSLGFNKPGLYYSKRRILQLNGIYEHLLKSEHEGILTNSEERRRILKNVKTLDIHFFKAMAYMNLYEILVKNYIEDRIRRLLLDNEEMIRNIAYKGMEMYRSENASINPNYYINDFYAAPYITR